MPKISNHRIQVLHKDIKEWYDITVMYNQEFKFYGVIPDVFNLIVKHLSKDEMDKLNITKRFAKGSRSNSVNDDFDAIVYSTTEKECVQLLKDALLVLVGKKIVKTNVIIVFFNPKDNCQYGEMQYNKEHPQIGMQFGLTYAVETSVGDKKVYSVYTEYETFGRKEVVRKEISLWNSSTTIIPDTKESRITLEEIYNAIHLLNTKLKEFTSTPEKLLGLIDSKIKLLNP